MLRSAPLARYSCRRGRGKHAPLAAVLTASGRRILLAEDDPHQRALLAVLLIHSLAARPYLSEAAIAWAENELKRH